MQTALVIGGSGGIGQAAAIELARRGFGLIITYRSHPEGAEETVRLIEEAGSTGAALPLDVADLDAFPAFRDRVAETLRMVFSADRIDALVNNAGVGAAMPFGEVTEEFWDRMHRILLKGPYFLTQTLLPLLADGGAIVNTTSSSTNTHALSAGYSVYASMKGGLVVATRYWAKELAPRGIRVNSVSPGVTRTRLGDDAFSKYPELIQPQADRTALGRIGEPDDVGKVIAFLASSDGGWVTAQNLEASGGYDL